MVKKNASAEEDQIRSLVHKYNECIISSPFFDEYTKESMQIHLYKRGQRLDAEVAEAGDQKWVYRGKKQVKGLLKDFSETMADPCTDILRKERKVFES